ncbi:MAG: GNAT family N-acetyltransferase [Phycisphaeraceae bacterium]
MALTSLRASDPKATDAELLARAAEVFVRGFAFTRSRTHPYLAERVGQVWALRDAPRRDRRYRREEWIACGVSPAELDRLARAQTRGRFAICPIHPVDQPDDELRGRFKALGYRLGTTEPLMVHDLKRVPRASSPARVERVRTAALAARLAQAMRSRPMPAEHLARDAPLRQYVALVDDEPAGWVRSVVVGDATSCSDMYVRPRYRRRGIARTLMGRMLRDDRRAGATLAVLTASHTGAKLYTGMGYTQVGTVYVYTPPRRRAGPSA